MKHLGALLLLAAAVRAQGVMEAGDAIDVKTCERVREEVIPRVEAFTRMKFRRSVPIRIETRAVWAQAQQATGYAGHSARHALAYYRPGVNDVTVVPWVIGRYPAPGTKGTPAKKKRADWIADLEPTLIHELCHAIHHQNFFLQGRAYGASLRMGGLSEEDLDQSTVQFLLGEGFPEFVSLRTTAYPEHMDRYPSPEPDSVRHYMSTYEPDGKQPYRIILSSHGYSDGLNLLHHLFLKAGPRGVRAALYRPTARRRACCSSSRRSWGRSNSTTRPIPTPSSASCRRRSSREATCVSPSTPGPAASSTAPPAPSRVRAAA